MSQIGHRNKVIFAVMKLRMSKQEALQKLQEFDKTDLSSK